MNRCQNDAEFLHKIIFSDESTFCLNGVVNRQNCRYWSATNQHWMTEAHTQYPQSVNVWAGSRKSSNWPNFFDENLTGERYLDFPQNDLIPALATLFPNAEDPDLPARDIWYQQDGAPPHFSRDVRNYLDTVFEERWIGRRGQIQWPARSLDLTPMVFFLWGYLKHKVYFNKPNSIDELKNIIRQEIRQIAPETVHNVLEEFTHRLAYCQEVNGKQFEHLI